VASAPARPPPMICTRSVMGSTITKTNARDGTHAIWIVTGLRSFTRKPPKNDPLIGRCLEAVPRP
jgi:hypothetical protein